MGWPSFQKGNDLATMHGQNRVWSALRLTGKLYALTPERTWPFVVVAVPDQSMEACLHPDAQP